jgi:ribosomal protein S18 acetylase RimI-like enzyme
MLSIMEIRSVKPTDLDALYDIDGTIDSTEYLHVERTGEGLAAAWSLAERPLRERRMLPNRLSEESRFQLKQIAIGADEGLVLVAEHDAMPVALLLAQADTTRGTIRVYDLRVDFDFRRNGLASAMMFQVIAAAREQKLRAVAIESTTDNVPTARFLAKCGFELAGLDTRRLSNHDLVKESVTLSWYLALD